MWDAKSLRYLEERKQECEDECEEGEEQLVVEEEVRGRGRR